MAFGDDLGSLKICRYPCIKKNFDYVSGSGHSSYITNVRFSADDRYVYSIGGEDKCVMVWKVIKNKWIFFEKTIYF